MAEGKIRDSGPVLTRPTTGPSSALTDPTPGTERAGSDGRPHGCHCGARWGGTSTAHCAAAGCHRTFGSVNGFDRHRRHGECLDPATLGMVERAGVWRRPMNDDYRERLATIGGAR